MRSRTPLALAAVVGLVAPATALASPANAAQAAATQTAKPAQTAASQPTATKPAKVLDGPHSPWNRPRQATKVTHVDGTVVRDFDLGDVNLGRGATPGSVRAPMRGILVTPDRPNANAPLVVISHLRMPGCSNDATVFPCPKGAKEMRYDRGMQYLAQSMAKQGYSVLVPDIAPLWAGRYMTADYDQYAGWLKTVGPIRDTVMRANAGKPTRLGGGLKGAIDGRRTGLLVHSRSAYIVNTAVAGWKTSSTPIASVMAYGGAYGAPEDDGTYTPAPPANLPYLGITSDSDNDVAMMGNNWAAEYTSQRRTAPWFEATLHGFGHAYVNRALSSIKRDDRIEPAGLPDAAAHEKLITGAAMSWFDQTIRGAKATYPMKATDALPTTFQGVPARWTAMTNAPYWGYAAGDPGLTAFGGGKLTVCRQYDAMDPTQYPDRCDSDTNGVIETMSKVARVTLTPKGGVRLHTLRPGGTAQRVDELAIQVVPSGGENDHKGSPLRVTVRLAGGDSYTVDVPRTHPALRDQFSDRSNGNYVVSTIRLPMPAKVTSGHVQSVELTGGVGTSHLDIRAVQLVGPQKGAKRPLPKPAPAPKPVVNPAPGTTVLVDTAPGAAGAALAKSQVQAAGGEVVAAWPVIGVTVARAKDDTAARAMALRLRGVRGIEKAGVSGHILREAPRLPKVTKDSRPKQITSQIAVTANAPAANRYTTGRGTTLAVVDNGFIEETPNLAPHFDATRSGTCTGGVFRQAGSEWRPGAGTPGFAHGTGVATVAAGASVGVGVRGVAPDATVVGIRVGDDEGNMYPEAAICSAMTVAAMHIPVANHSYGVDTISELRHGFYDPINADQAAVIESVNRAFAYSRDHGVLNVAATGNTGEDQSSKPTIPLAGYESGGPIPARTKALLGEVPGVVGVSEHQVGGKVAFESTVGLGIADIAADGAGTVPDGKGGYEMNDGTSFASPAVAGAAVLVKALHPTDTPAQVEAVLEAAARQVPCSAAGEIVSQQPCRTSGGLTSYFGHGQLDVAAAVTVAR